MTRKLETLHICITMLSFCTINYNAEFAECLGAMASEASCSYHVPMTMEATWEGKIQFESRQLEFEKIILV